MIGFFLSRLPDEAAKTLRPQPGKIISIIARAFFLTAVGAGLWFLSSDPKDSVNSSEPQRDSASEAGIVVDPRVGAQIPREDRSLFEIPPGANATLADEMGSEESDLDGGTRSSKVKEFDLLDSN